MVGLKVLGKLFRRRDGKTSNVSYGEFEDRIQNAQVGGVFTVTGLELDYDEAYFFIEKKKLVKISMIFFITPSYL